MSTETKPITRIEPYGRIYGLRREEVIAGFCPEIYPCRRCGSPVARGYVCMYCGEDNSVAREKREK